MKEIEVEVEEEEEEAEAETTDSIDSSLTKFRQVLVESAKKGDCYTAFSLFCPSK